MLLQSITSLNCFESAICFSVCLSALTRECLDLCFGTTCRLRDISTEFEVDQELYDR
jgi:hypothetical protein